MNYFETMLLRKSNSIIMKMGKFETIVAVSRRVMRTLDSSAGPLKCISALRVSGNNADAAVEMRRSGNFAPPTTRPSSLSLLHLHTFSSKASSDVEDGEEVDEKQMARILASGRKELFDSEEGREKVRASTYDSSVTATVILEAAEEGLKREIGGDDEVQQKDDAHKAHVSFLFFFHPVGVITFFIYYFGTFPDGLIHLNTHTPTYAGSC